MAGAYKPHVPAPRPGGKPSGKPRYRVLVHRQYRKLWEELPERVNLQSAQFFWDHVAQTPGSVAPIYGSSYLKGRASRPKGPGFSRTIHYELSSKARIDYQFNDAYVGRDGDPHAVVFILSINTSSH